MNERHEEHFYVREGMRVVHEPYKDDTFPRCPSIPLAFTVVVGASDAIYLRLVRTRDRAIHI